MPPKKARKLHDTHPTGKSRTTRGAPNDYYLVAAGNPAKNTTGKLYKPAPTDDAIWAGMSPFLAINEETKNRSAAVRTTMIGWINAIKVNSTGEYHIDYLTTIFLAWVWQMTRNDPDRIFSEIAPGSYVRYPFNSRFLEHQLKEVINRTFAADVAARLTNGAIEQLKAIANARKTSQNVDTLPFQGIRASKALAKVPPPFRDYVRSLIAEHPLEIGISIAFLHMSPPAPPLPKHVAETYAAYEVRDYEEGRKDQRRLAYNKGRMALIAPLEAVFEAQRMLPTSHPIDPRKIVAPIKRALEHANCLTQRREEAIAAAGSLPKKLSKAMGTVTMLTTRAGGIKLSGTTRPQVDLWNVLVQDVDPLICSHFAEDNGYINRSTALVVDAFRKGFRVVVLPAIFKTTTDFQNLLTPAKFYAAVRADKLDVPQAWYEPDALIPRASEQSNGAIGIIVRHGKPLTWAAVSHCWSGMYTTVFVAVQVSRAIQDAMSEETPLAMDLLGWGPYHTELLFGQALGEAKFPPVCCKPYLLVPETLQVVANQPQCTDEAARAARLEEHALIESEVAIGEAVTSSTIDKLIIDSGARKRKRDVAALDFLGIIRRAPKAIDAVTPAPEEKRRKVNLNRFIPQPRGTRPKHFRWDPDNACYIQTKQGSA